MDLINNTKTQDLETNTNSTPQLTKNLSFTNESIPLKPHPQPMMVTVSYKECLKNHAANIGGYSLDGCGEFMPLPNSNSLSDPKSLKCAACGCHRNFHRRETQEDTPSRTTQLLNFRQRYPPHPYQPLLRSSSPSLSPKSPQPVQQGSCYATTPHMLIALNGNGDGNKYQELQQKGFLGSESLNKRKRFRTKFSQEQKERMFSFADKLGWKMKNSEENSVEEFCKDVGVTKKVFKVWMHNHKNSVQRISDINDDNPVAASAIANGGHNISINVNGDFKREDFEGNDVGHNASSSS